MYFHAYTAVLLYVLSTEFLAVFFMHMHMVTVQSLLLRVRRRLRAVSALAPRGRSSRRFVAQQLSAGRLPKNQLDQVCTTEQLQPVATCIGTPLLRAEVPLQSWLAAVHEVTSLERSSNVP
jgi:hypothetical protein